MSFKSNFFSKLCKCNIKSEILPTPLFSSGQREQFMSETNVNLFYPLIEANSYPNIPYLDMVLRINFPGDSRPFPNFLLKNAPGPEPRTLRLWLKTTKKDTVIQINDKKFTPITRNTRSGWTDFGCFREDAVKFGVPGFGIIRFFGIEQNIKEDCVCVITNQTDIDISNCRIEEAQQKILGISRRDVGKTMLSPNKVEVGQSQYFEMTYKVGANGLPKNSLIRLTIPSAYSQPQNENQNKPGWIECLNSNLVSLVSISKSYESTVYNDVIFRVKKALPTDFLLSFFYFTKFIYIFQSHWKSMERRYWWSHLPLLALAVSVDDRRIFVPPLEKNGHSLEIESGPAQQLFLFLPGRIREGGDIYLSGVFTDRYRNIPKKSPIRNDFSLFIKSNKSRIPFGTPAKHFTKWNRFQKKLPNLKSGVYRVYALQNESKQIIACSNPLEIMVKEDSRNCIFWGEIHGHTQQSDGTGDYNDLFSHAQEIGNLDFAAAADHACYHTDNQWLWMKDVVNHYNKDNCFTTILGYEWAGKQGHRNIYSSKNDLELFRGMYPGTRELYYVYNKLNGKKHIVAGTHVHHTRDFFADYDSSIQRFFEIYSMWGNYEKKAYNILNQGGIIGFTGGGDCHEGKCGFSVEDANGQGNIPHTFAPRLLFRCGLTGAMMKELNRSELIEALRDRRTYATSGARILLEFSINDLHMGQSGEVIGDPCISSFIYACGNIEKVEIIRNGEAVFEETPNLIDFKCKWEDKHLERGNYWYVIKMKQIDDHIVWSSPIWITKTN